jgi:hypothetical protein
MNPSEKNLLYNDIEAQKNKHNYLEHPSPTLMQSIREQVFKFQIYLGMR